MSASPSTLRMFDGWCRAQVAIAVFNGHLPSLVFGDGPDHEEPLVAIWELDDEQPPIEEFLDRILPNWAADTGSSQVSVCLPMGGDGPSAFLMSADETGLVAATARITVDDQIRLLSWQDYFGVQLPYHRWQQLLAANAGYRAFTKWCCLTCESVCPGEAEIVPTPCDFCGGDDIEAVDKMTPLAAPKPPYDGDYDAEAVSNTPLLETVLALINDRNDS